MRQECQPALFSNRGVLSTQAAQDSGISQVMRSMGLKQASMREFIGLDFIAAVGSAA
jgi:hypothetical protein